MKRYSKKRQSILECLKATDTHPTAEWVYQQLKPQYPDLSPATVYRNLNEMKSDGSVLSLGVVGDKERFDGRTDPHIHMICKKCGRISDVTDMALPKELTETAGKFADFTVSSVDLHYVGICGDCKRKESET